MSYAKMMKWNKRHRKGTKQPCIMHTESGFWPSGAFIQKWIKYTEQCKENGFEPLGCEQYYKSQIS